MLPSPTAIRHLAGELVVASTRLREARARLLATAAGDDWAGPAQAAYTAAVAVLAGRLAAQADGFDRDAARVRAMAGRVVDELAVLARLEHSAVRLLHRLAGDVVSGVVGETRWPVPW